jgi:oxygen-independent coproporphyrinogen-3 oxidase
VDAYVDAVTREAELARQLVAPTRTVHQVALGGGTPNFLDEKQLDRLLGALLRAFALDPEAELSVEIDPRTATESRLDRFLQHGFNRFSAGVQDLAEEVVRNLRVGASRESVERVTAFLRTRGVRHINFDLIYGLPGQNLESAVRTARSVVDLAPSRIALYSYAHVPWIHPHQKRLEELGLPSPQLKAEIFLQYMDLLHEAGYVSIGMDHFARPDDPLARAAETRTLRRNFMGYTTGRGRDVVAFGASAISAVGASYSQNVKPPAEYIRQVAAGELPIVRGRLLSRDDEIRRELILDLFCNFEADLTGLEERFGIEAESYFRDELTRLIPMQQDGLVEVGGSRIRLTPQGRFFVRNLCMVFDRRLEAESATQVYSRTV